MKKTYRQRFKLRRPVKGARFVETGVPWLVVESEAQAKGMSVDQFLEEYVVECLFNDFDGIIYRFVPRTEQTELTGQTE